MLPVYAEVLLFLFERQSATEGKRPGGMASSLNFQVKNAVAEAVALVVVAIVAVAVAAADAEVVGSYCEYHAEK